MDSVRKDPEKITYRSKDFRATVAIALSFFLSKDNLAALCLINGVMRLIVQHKRFNTSQCISRGNGTLP